MDVTRNLAALLDPSYEFFLKMQAAININDEIERLNEVIEDHQRREAARASKGPSGLGINDAFMAEIAELMVQQGKPIMAIKFRRALTGEGLKEAKDWVDPIRRKVGHIV